MYEPMPHTAHPHQHDRIVLQRIAERAMRERGLWPIFSADVEAQLRTLESAGAAVEPDGHTRDLRALAWSSIDNDDSRDLDQLTVAAALADDVVRVLVAVADVDALVRKGTPIDQHAAHNTTSVYTAARIFPMLPEQLSTDLTSLNPDVDRLAVIVELTVGADGSVQDSGVYRALVRNQAKLAYRSVAAWLDGTDSRPAPIDAVHDLEDNLRLQDQVAQRMKRLRHAQGALSLQTLRARPVFEGDAVHALEEERSNRATEIIENFMVAANGVTARFLAAERRPSIRRVVRVPKRWDRIVALAAEHGASLPADPDPLALDQFLVKQQAADPMRFPDLSLTVVKLLGSGEYVAEPPEGVAPGHFGLAVKDYAHSTAPNRRYPDLVTQRLLKAALAGDPTPYAFDELASLAAHLTAQEDAANKVERQVAKSAAAILLQSRIGEQFGALVTGASSKGTWARLLTVPAEGRVVRGFEGADVGDQIRVRLASVDVERGFIDFERVANGHG
jgi:exoribonuclease-2